METDPVQYLTYTEAILHHIELMRALGETRFGISIVLSCNLLWLAHDTLQNTKRPI